MNPDGFPTVRFSTSDLPEKDRIAMWHDHYCRIAMKLEIEPLNDAPLECSVLARALPGVQVVSTALSPARVRRTREFLADGNGDLVFIINQSGAATAQARGREVTLREGDALLMSTAEVKVFDRHLHGGSLSFRIPRPILAAVVADVDDVVMQLIPHQTEALKLLAGYAAPLFNDIALATPNSAALPSTTCMILSLSRLGRRMVEQALRMDAERQQRGSEWRNPTSSRTATGAISLSVVLPRISG